MNLLPISQISTPGRVPMSLVFFLFMLTVINFLSCEADIVHTCNSDDSCLPNEYCQNGTCVLQDEPDAEDTNRPDSELDQSEPDDTEVDDTELDETSYDVDDESETFEDTFEDTLEDTFDEDSTSEELTDVNVGDIYGVIRLEGQVSFSDSHVSLLNTSYTAITDEDGNWEITGVTAGNYSIRVSHEGYLELVVENMEVLAGGRVEVDQIILEEFDNQGDPCGEQEICRAGFCVDGYCCNDICEGTCRRCDLEDSEGICSHTPEGQDLDDECEPGESACGLTGDCDGNGACEFQSVEIFCDDQNSCTDNTHCNGEGGCIGEALPDNSLCNSNRGACTSGQCLNFPFALPLLPDNFSWSPVGGGSAPNVPEGCEENENVPCNLGEFFFSWPRDSGITVCYDNEGILDPCPGAVYLSDCSDTGWCGQDAQHGPDWSDEGWQTTRFVETGDGIIKDMETGLVWQQDMSEQTSLTWPEALTICSELDLSGLTGWKLPDRYELATLINYGRRDPAFHLTDHRQDLKV